MKACPYCAEEIQDAATKCKHCGEWLDERQPEDSLAVPVEPVELPLQPELLDVWLAGTGGRVITVVKGLRQLNPALSLKQAKELAVQSDSYRVRLWSGLTSAEADARVGDLTRASKGAAQLMIRATIGPPVDQAVEERLAASEGADPAGHYEPTVGSGAATTSFGKDRINSIMRPDGSFKCLRCGSTQFEAKRSTGRKVALGFASLLTSTNEVRCLGCGTKYKR